ncbi:MAG TPA: SH3 domain-containing protein [Actinocatenispora sp.]
MRLRKPVIAVAMTAAVAAGAGAWATAASAQPAAPASCPDNSWKYDSGTGKIFTANGVHIRTGPSTSCTSLGLGYTSHSVTVHCSKDHVTWSHIRDNTTGVSGWVDYHYLNVVGVSCGS